MIRSIYQLYANYLKWILKSYFIAFGLACSFNASIVNAQSALSPHIIPYGIRENLLSATIYCIFQDDDDKIWLGTERGLYSYDGISFQLYSKPGLSDNIIFQIQKMSDGNLLLSTFSQGLFMLNPKTETVSPHPQNYLINGILRGVHPSSVYTVNDTVWFAKMTHPNNNEAEFCSIYKVFSDTIQIETRNLGKIGWSQTYHREGNIVAWTNDHHCDWTKVRGIWKGMNSSKKEFWYIQHDLKSTVVVNILNEEKRSHNFNFTINNTYEDRKGQIWICSEKGLLLLHETTNWSYTQYFEDLVVSQVIHAREGGYWIATLNKGLFYVPNFNLKKVIDGFFTNIELSPDLPSPLWATSYRGILVEINAKGTKNYELELHSTNIFYQKSAKRLWVNQGFYFDEKQKLHKSNWFAYLTVKKICTVDSNTFALAHNGGLAFYDISKDKFTSINGYQGRGSTVLFDAARNWIWLGTPTGIWIYDLNNKEFEFLRDPTLGSYIRCFQFIDPSSLLVGTQGNGLVLVNIDKLNNIVSNPIKYFEKHIINNICADKANKYWLSTNKGAYLIEMVESQPNILAHFNMHNGLPHTEVNDIELNDSLIYFASSGGINSISREMLEGNLDFSPRIRIKEIFSFGKALNFPLTNKVLRLKHYQNQLQFCFVAIAHQGSILYRYRLVGLENEWKETTQKEAIYFKLPPGKYSFEVAARRGDYGNWSDSEKVEFVLAAHFTYSLWFYLSMSLVIILIGFLLRNRQNKIESKRKNNKQRIFELEYKALKAQMNPHFVFNALQSILALVRLDKKTEARKYLTDFSKLFRNNLDHSNRSFIRLEEEIEALKLYTELELLRWGHKVVVYWEVPEATEDLQILVPPMLIQPIIENAFVHGFKTISMGCEIKIQVSFDEDFCWINIIDNGIGLHSHSSTEDAKHQSTALDNIKERVQKIKEAFNFPIEFQISQQSQSEKSGTKAIFKFPKIFSSPNN